MSISSNSDLMRQIIMDHYSKPRNKKTPIDNSYLTIHMDSVSCIDDLHIYLKIKNDIVEDVLWDGVGCAISIASTSIMSELIKGLTLNEANKVINNYLAMLKGKPFDEEILDEAIVFINTGKQASRIKCATIGWEGLKHLLDQAEGINKWLEE